MNRFRYFICFAMLAVQAQAQISPFCPGQTTTGYVVELTEHQGQLYAAGLFSRICGKLAKSIARWDGTQWNPLTNATGSVIDAVHALEVIDDKLYMAKYEWQADSNWLVRVENNTLYKVLPGFWRTNPNPNLNQVPILYDVVSFQGQIIVSGEFNRAGGQTINGIARYTGNGWAPLEEGLTGYLPNTYNLIAPHGMLVWNDNLYVAGNFLKAGNVTANGAARWDGTRWHAMGEGFNKAVYGFGVFQGSLYACGEFTASGATPLGGIARWDGSAWVDPGFHFIKSNSDELLYIHTLREVDGRLYVLGGFSRVLVQGDTLDCSAVVAFDGSKLDLLEGGLPNFDAEAILPYQGDILIGGGIINGSSGYIGVYGKASGAENPIETEVAAPFIFPNPAEERIRLQLPETGKASFTLYNALGNAVTSGELHNIRPEIDLRGLPAGVYLLAVEHDLGRLSGKLVKQ